MAAAKNRLPNDVASHDVLPLLLLVDDSDAILALEKAALGSTYRLETAIPPPYGPRPSHIHLLVDARGFEGLITQHYPKKGKRGATLDLVIVPETKEKEQVRNPRGR